MEEICTENNITSTFKCVCSNLETLGIPAQTYKHGEEKKALVFVLNSLWTLIKQSKSNVVKLNNNNEQFIRLNSEIKRLNQSIKSMEATELSRSEDFGILKSKFSLVETEKQGLISQIKLLKKECNKLASALETDRKVYLKNNKDHKELIHKLNEKMFIRKVSSPSIEVTPNTHSSQRNNIQEVMNECVQTLDNTIQNLLGEIAAIRCSFMKLFLDLRELVTDLHSNISSVESPITTDLPEVIFQLPHEQFLKTINLNINLLTEFIRERLGLQLIPFVST